MNYICKPGIVRLEICGEYLLVPTRAISEENPSVLKLNLVTATIWEEIEKGNNMDRLVMAFNKLTHLPKDEIKVKLDEFAEILYQKGYLIKTEQH